MIASQTDTQIKDIYMLSPCQKSMLFFAGERRSEGLYVIQVQHTLKGRWQEALLKGAVESLVQRHDVLRSRIMHRDVREPLQVILQAASGCFESTDLRGRTDQTASVTEARRQDAQRNFDVSRDALFRAHLMQTADDSYELLLSAHHIILDGWSMTQLFFELFELYRSLDEATPAQLPERASFKHFIHWAHQQNPKDAQSIWEEAFEDFQGPYELILPEAAPDSPVVPGFIAFRESEAEIEVKLDPSWVSQLRRFAGRQAVTLNNLVQAAWGLTLARMSGQEEAVFGITTSGRSGDLEDLDSIIGMMINTLPLRLSMKAEVSVKDYLKQVKTQSNRVIQFEHTPLFEVNRWVNPRRDRSLFESILVFENYPAVDQSAGIDKGTWVHSTQSFEKSDTPLTLVMGQAGQETVLIARFWSNRFSKTAVRNCLMQLGQALMQLSEDANAPLFTPKTDDWLEQVAAVWEHYLYVKPTAADSFFNLGGHSMNALQIASHLRQEFGIDVSYRLLFEYPVLEAFSGQLQGLKPVQATAAPAVVDGPWPLSSGQKRLWSEESFAEGSSLYTSPVSFRLHRHLEPAQLQDFVNDLLQRHDALRSAVVLDADGRPLLQDWGTNCERPRVLFTDLSSFAKTAAEEHMQKELHELCQKKFDLQQAPLVRPVLFRVNEQESVVALIFHHLIMDGRSQAVLMQDFAAFMQNESRVVPAKTYGAFLRWQAEGIASNAYWQGLFSKTDLPPLIDLKKGTNTDPGMLEFTLPVVQSVASRRHIARLTSSGFNYFLAQFKVAVAALSGERDICVSAPFEGRPDHSFQQTVGMFVATLPLRTKLDPGQSFDELVRTLMRKTQEAHQHQQLMIDELSTSLGLRGKGVRNPLIQLNFAFLPRNSHANRDRAVWEPFALDYAPQIFPLGLTLVEEEDQFRFFLSFDGKTIDADGAELLKQKLLEVSAMYAEDPRKNMTSFLKAPVNENAEILRTIWQKVLKVDEVSDQDDFFDLGGDSITAIQLVSLAQKHGIKIKPQLVLEHSVFSELMRQVGVSAPTKALPEVVVEETTTPGPLPLSPIQKWFFELPLQQPHWWNQDNLFKLPEADFESLQEAFRQLIRQHAALRLSFHRNAQGQYYQQYESEDVAYEFSLEQFHWGSIPAEKQTALLQRETRRLQSSFDLQQAPLIRAAVFHLGRGEQRLFISIHHLVVDSVSWRILLEDLNRCYYAHKAGQPAVLAPRSAGYHQWVKAQAQLNRDDLIPAWRSALAHQKAYFPVSGAARGQRVQRLQVSKEASERWDEKRRQLQISMQDIVAAGLVEAAFGFAGSHDLTLDMETHGRQDLGMGLETGNTVGWFTGIYPVRFTRHEDMDGMLRAAHQSISQTPDQGVSFGILRYLSASNPFADLATPEILMNYLGRVDHAHDDKSILKPCMEKPAPFRSETETPSHRLEVVAYVEAEGHLVLQGFFDDRIPVEQQEKFWTLLKAFFEGQNPKPKAYGDSFARSAEAFQNTLKPEVKTQIQNVYPILPRQEGLLHHSLYGGNEPIYVTQTRFHFRGAVMDTALVRAAFSSVVNAYDVLKTSFHMKFENSLQVVWKSVTAHFSEHDFSQLDKKDQTQRANQIAAALKKQNFDFEQPSLIRLAVFNYGQGSVDLVLTFHHALLDGWSVSMLANELFASLQSHAMGEIWAPRFPTAYEPFVRWVMGCDAKAMRSFWNNYLKDIPKSVALPFSRSGRSDEVRRTLEEKIHLALPVSQGLRRLAGASHVSLNTLMQAAWGLLLKRSHQNADVIFGVTVSGRNPEVEAVESLMGLFINTLPLRIAVDEESTVSQYLQLVKKSQSQILDHDAVSLIDIQNAAEIPHSEGLFQSLLVYENYQVTSDENLQKDQPVQMLGSSTVEEAHYPLTLAVVPSEELLIKLLFDSRLFTATGRERLVRTFRQLLVLLSEARPESLLGSVPLTGLYAPAFQFKRHSKPDAQAEPPTLWNDFAAAVARHPEAPAARFTGRTLSYRELQQAALLVAERLAAAGVQPGSVVGVLLPRSLSSLISMLAIFRVGAVYLPLDPEYPRERLKLMLDDAAAALVISDAGHQNFVRDGKVLVFQVDHEAKPTAVVLPEPPKPTDIAYIIYTSGTTGKPKGALLSHENAASTLRAQVQAYHLNEGARIIHMSSLNFDASLIEIYLAFSCGGCAVIGTRNQTMPGRLLSRFLEEERINATFMSPSLLNTLDPGEYRELNTLLIGGEKSSRALVKRWAKPWRRYFNLYGATESGIYSTAQICQPDAEIPGIGYPLANADIYLLDAYLNPVAEGMVGEIYIGGTGIGAGYLHQPQLTAVHFLPDVKADRPGSRMYKTQDLGMIDESGHLVYMGRLDRQTKWRGRLEIEEIEAVLSTAPGVRQALVRLEENGEEKTMLAHLLIQRDEYEQDRVYQHARARLPAYMLPQQIVISEHWPINPNGKVETSSLPRSGQAFLPMGERLPRTASEWLVHDVWQKILQLDENLAIDQNFFDLGGHSLVLHKMLGLIEQQVGAALPLEQVMESLTIEHLASLIEKSGSRPAPTLLTLQKKGQRTPVFAVHPGAGQALIFSEWARQSSNRPIHAFQLPSPSVLAIDGPEGLHKLAAYYVERMLTVQPQGPYQLLAYCVGGSVALEMTRLLHERGHEVQRLAWLDSPHPDHNRETLTHLRDKLHGLFGIWDDRTPDVDHDPELLKAHYQQVLRRKELVPATLPDGEVRAYIDQAVSFLDAVVAWHPRPLLKPIPILQLRPLDRSALDDKRGPDFGWKRLIPTLDVRDIPGRHENLLNKAQIPHLLEILDSYWLD